MKYRVEIHYENKGALTFAAEIDEITQFAEDMQNNNMSMVNDLESGHDIVLNTRTMTFAIIQTIPDEDQNAPPERPWEANNQ